MEFSEIKDIVNSVVRCFLENERDLLERNAHEQTITFSFAYYLHQQFPEWDINCEYNLRDGKTKILHLMRGREETYMVEQPKRVRPDIIVHHRGEEYGNLLVIEAKKTSSQESDDFDLHKLQKFIEQLQYQYAVFLKFIVGNEPDVEIRWVKV